MMPLYTTASRFDSSLVRAQMTYLRRDVKESVMTQFSSSIRQKSEENREQYLIQFEWDSLTPSMYSYVSSPL